MKNIGCIIARTNSSRLPKKVLKNIKNKKLIEHIIDRIKKVENIDKIYMCTSIHKDDKKLISIAKENNIYYYAGSKKSVIDRMINVGNKEKADNLIRITGDNIFTDPIFLERMIAEHEKNKSDYTRTAWIPFGTSAEVISLNSLERCYKNIDPNKSEYLTVYMFQPSQYKCVILLPPNKFQCPYYTLTVDTPEDLKRTNFIYENIDKKEVIYLDEILKLNKNKSIPYITMDKNKKIKLPDEKKLSYKEYRKELNIKIRNSINVKLEDDFYEKNKK